jgi:predicted GIY-YIG superfamily endonuclease
MKNDEAKEKLAELYKEKTELKKRLEKINAGICKYQRMLEEDDIIKIVSNVIEDDKKFVDWFIERQEKIQKRKTKGDIKEKILKQDFNSITEQNKTYLYSLKHNGEIVYIGITKNIKNRMNDHKRSKKVFDRYDILNVHSDRFYALREENNLIKQHKPKYNKQIFD